MCKIEQNDLDRLKKEVETLMGRNMKTPRDFDYLSRQIEGYMGESISVSTLKRMWGYVKANSKPSLYNLDLLSHMVGYSDWASFCELKSELDSSRFFVKSKLMSQALEVGEEVRLTWCPGRVVTLSYMDNDVFRVVESVESKLSEGDTFTCHQFVADEPLYLSNLQHQGMPSCNYVCGQAGGIKWILWGGKTKK